MKKKIEKKGMTGISEQLSAEISQIEKEYEASMKRLSAKYLRQLIAGASSTLEEQLLRIAVKCVEESALADEAIGLQAKESTPLPAAKPEISDEKRAAGLVSIIPASTEDDASTVSGDTTDGASEVETPSGIPAKKGKSKKKSRKKGKKRSVAKGAYKLSSKLKGNIRKYLDGSITKAELRSMSKVSKNTLDKYIKMLKEG